MVFFGVDIGYSVGVSCSLEGPGCRATSLPDIEVAWYFTKTQCFVELVKSVERQQLLVHGFVQK